MPNSYILDPAWQQEHDRLQALEDLFDQSSRRRLAGVGVGEGWRCLEVGAGAGGVAAWLAERVGPTGHVLAADVDARFVHQEARDNLEVRRHDVASDPLEEASFDLVHARAVLEHLPGREQTLASLVRAVRPRGWVVVEDIDFGGAMAAAIARYVSPSEEAPLFERLFRAVEAVFRSVRADASFGARLLGALQRAGLHNLGADVFAPLVAGGGKRDWVRLTVEQLIGPLLATDLVTEADIEQFLRAMAEPSCHFLPPMMVGAWGQRTPGGDR